MKNYHIQHGCHDCRHVFEMMEHDSDSCYYCKLKAGRRPKCGSVAMEEYFLLPDKNYLSAYRKWERWAKGREVVAWGICNDWKA
jgi:hypothetical protein